MAFTEIEKENIKERLIKSCEESWSVNGYKKTNVEDLCRSAGISKGAFYLFYASKEELFLEVMIYTQNRLMEIVKEGAKEDNSKEGLIKILKQLYREYISVSFLNETENPDFIAFINKLDKDKIKKMEEHGNYDMRNVMKLFKVKYKIPEEMALSALSYIFAPKMTHRFAWDYLEVFDFILESVANSIFL